MSEDDMCEPSSFEKTRMRRNQLYLVVKFAQVQFHHLGQPQIRLIELTSGLIQIDWTVWQAVIDRAIAMITGRKFGHLGDHQICLSGDSSPARLNIRGLHLRGTRLLILVGGDWFPRFRSSLPHEEYA